MLDVTCVAATALPERRAQWVPLDQAVAPGPPARPEPMVFPAHRVLTARLVRME